MVNSILRDQRRRFLFSRLETKRLEYKALLQDTSCNETQNKSLQIQKVFAQKALQSGSITRVKRRCVYTGRGGGVLRISRTSRILFRELANRGLLNGVQKASW